MAYGQALKQRVLAMYDDGERTRAIARRYRVSESWCRRVKQRRHEPPRRVGGKAFKLDEAACQQLRGWITQQPDATLDELRQRCGEELQLCISIGALWKTLRRMKLSLKKSR
jgi:transposase